MKQNDGMACQPANSLPELRRIATNEIKFSLVGYMNLMCVSLMEVLRELRSVMIPMDTITVQTIRRIGVHTSTIRGKTIMTISVKTIIATNILKDNEVINFKDDRWVPEFDLAGVAWLISAFGMSHRESRRIVLEKLHRLMAETLSDYRVWFLIGHSAWQDNSRIMKYRKLWGALRRRGVNIPESEQAVEELVEHEGRIKYFGAIPFFHVPIDVIVDAMQEEGASCIVAIPAKVNFDISGVLREGWSPSYPLDKSLMLKIANIGGVIFKHVGEFDDADSGFIAIARPSVIKRLVAI